MKRSLIKHLYCRLSGEVPADTLEAYRRANGPVYDMLDRVERRRLECRAEGMTPWTVPAAIQIQMLCAWNSFVLQELGDRFLDADYACNPATVGYVPPITHDQTLAFYGQVENWLTRASQADANPEYHLDVVVPADLPPWSEVEPCPNSHLHAMIEAMRSVSDHARAAMIFVPDNETLQNHKLETQANRIRQLLAAAQSKATYAEQLHGDNPTRDVHERVEPYVKEAIELFYKLGQYIAMPDLADRQPEPPLQPGILLSKPKLPWERGFDPWCLTDPAFVDEAKKDKAAVKAIDKLWRLDPAPALTLSIHAEISAALARGDIEYAFDPKLKVRVHFFCCPWGPVYLVRRPVTLDGKRLKTMQQFVFDVTGEGMNLGHSFRRRILTGAFQSTKDFEYGDPNEAPDH